MLFIQIMQTLAMLKRRSSTWTFVRDESGDFVASNNFGKTKTYKDVEELRNFYKFMVSVGFKPIDHDITPSP